ncbi:DUF1559 domain-containing protein, partial [Gemmata sp. JC673]|nr:DUF1559 domain-containing protein [Gemmata algarum]
IGLGIHNWSTASDGRLPRADGRPVGAENTEDNIFFALLPYVEVGGVKRSDTQALLHRVPILVCPLDPTAADLTGEVATHPISSYAGNAQVFQGTPYLDRSVTDGLSNTIFFAEHYAVNCGADGAEFWFFWDSADMVGGWRRATFADAGPIDLT